MPTLAMRPCSHPGCTALVARGSRCGAHVRTQTETNYRRWYQTDKWKQIRRAQLLKEPWCALCLRKDQWVQATDVDHIQPHRGNESLFYAGPFQSLCHRCHSSKTRREVIA